jgi:hypothetical protein
VKELRSQSSSASKREREGKKRRKTHRCRFVNVLHSSFRYALMHNQITSTQSHQSLLVDPGTNS